MFIEFVISRLATKQQQYQNPSANVFIESAKYIFIEKQHDHCTPQ
jgi:hypothetical protein